MSKISILTPQNIELEYDLASLGDRIVAAIIDRLILIAYGIIILVIATQANFSGDIMQLFIFVISLPIIFYSLLSEVFMNGQTIGKRVMKIKVISINGNQPTFSQYLLRWLFRIIDLWMTGSILGIIMIAVNEKRQRLGDIVAGTTLIKTTPRTSINDTLYVPVAETNYKATYPEVINLKDSDIQLVKEVIMNVHKSGNTLLAYQTMQKIETVLNIKSQHEPLTFLYAVLSDYNHLSIIAS
ncbi:RDD family protein [Parasediminibacterium paludis]|uniref:RDD family protein n=1 Tax=Parasediminibacterium paludis TaxID=908966 RepID=A0ABV8Q0S7_9BACT